jgi:Spy/CpxP family protein refolding chaperone
MKRAQILALAALLTIAPTISFAQGPVSPQPGGPSDDTMVNNPTPPGRGPALSEEKRDEIRKKVEAIRIWKLTEELKLDANASAKLASLLSSMDQKRKETMREYMNTMRTLRVYLKSAKPDEAKIKPTLEKLENKHREMQEIRELELKNVRELLTIEQQARFLIFQQKFQSEMRSMIAGARGGGPGKGGMGPDGGPGMKGGQMPGGTGRPPDK